MQLFISAMVCETADKNTTDVRKTLTEMPKHYKCFKLMSLNTKLTVLSEQYTDFKRSSVRSLEYINSIQVSSVEWNPPNHYFPPQKLLLLF